MHTNDSDSSMANDCFVKAKELAASGHEREAIEFLFASIALSDGTNLEAREMLAKVFFNNEQYAQVIEQCELIDPDRRNFTLNELRRKARRELDSKFKTEKPVPKSKAPVIILSALIVLSIVAALSFLNVFLFKKQNPRPIPIEQVANVYYENIVQYPGLEAVLVNVNGGNNAITVAGEVPSQTHKSLLAEAGRQWASLVIFNLDQVVIKKEPTTLPYYVKPGDTLSKIARAFYKDPDRWVEILEANQGIINNPRNIQVGLKINIPIIN